MLQLGDRATLDMSPTASQSWKDFSRVSTVTSVPCSQRHKPADYFGKHQKSPGSRNKVPFRQDRGHEILSYTRSLVRGESSISRSRMACRIERVGAGCVFDRIPGAISIRVIDIRISFGDEQLVVVREHVLIAIGIVRIRVEIGF